MNLIKDYQEYQEILKGFRKKGVSYEKNFFLLPKEIRSLIEEARLYYLIENEILYLLVDEGHHYHLYYFWDLSRTPVLPELDKPGLIENIYNENAKQENNNLIREMLLNAGAVFKKKSYQIEIESDGRKALLDAEYSDTQEKLKKYEMEFAFAQKEDIPEVKVLWDNHLEAFDFNNFTETTIDKMLAEKQIIVIKDKLGKVVATECMDIFGNRSLSYHLVVAPEARGRSLGKAFMCEWLKRTEESGIATCNCWIAEDNTVSMNCHLKAGHKTGKVSEQYIIPEKQ